ncbi:MAG: ABC transporter ATP-binding protein [Oscillospiraceae bacterium]|nr:ABC transporter ATP-binding protein [Oscillospiraceae bacterium]
MKLEGEKVRTEKLYCIGYSSKLDKYLLSCVVPWHLWYNRYYEITKKEYENIDSDASELDMFVDYLHKKSYESERFLFSDMVKENNDSQAKMKAIAESI